MIAFVLAAFVDGVHLLCVIPVYFLIAHEKKIMKEKKLITINCVSIFQELLKALIGFIDVAGLYFALTQLTHRNISQNHKFQAVGLGK